MYEYVGVEKDEKNDGVPTATSSSDFEQQINACTTQDLKEFSSIQEVNLSDE